MGNKTFGLFNGFLQGTALFKPYILISTHYPHSCNLASYICHFIIGFDADVSIGSPRKSREAVPASIYDLPRELDLLAW